MRLLILSFFILFSAIVFSQKATITGTITGFKNRSEVCLGDAELGIIIEKTEIKNNRFSFENPTSFSPKMMFMYIKEDKINYDFDYFYIDNQNIVLSGSKLGIPKNIKIEGSKSENERKLFEESYYQLQLKSDSIYNLAIEKKKDTIKYKKEDIDIDRSNFKKNEQQIELQKIAYIKQNPNQYKSLRELFWLKEKFEKEQVREIYNQLDEKLKQSDFGMNLKIYLDLEKVLQEGDYYQDFQAKDVNDISHKLSDFIGTKYILLDFIQSYCPGCVMSIDELKIINEKYKDEIQIITFCGDKSEKIWKDGLKEHKTNWLSLWNNEGLNGKFSQTYGTDGTPTFIFISPEGKIIKKQYGFEAGFLEKFIETIFIKK